MELDGEAEEEIYKRTGVSTLDLDKKIRIEVDILNYTIGEVLFIECENGK